MAESHVVSGLISKRSELAGLIEHHVSAMNALKFKLTHLDATIKIFAPEIDLRTMRSKEHRVRNPIFGGHEAPRRIMDALRTSGNPMTSRALIESILASKNIDATPEYILAGQKSVLLVLNTLVAKGRVKIADPTVRIGRAWVLV